MMARLVRHWVGGVVAIACALSVGGCSAMSTGAEPVVSVRSEDILLLPPEEAGEAGWCMKTGATVITGCAAYTRARLPIVAESWSGEGGGASEQIRGFALTTGEVTHVVLKGQAIPTRAETMLPDGLRAVSVTFRGKGPSNGEPFPRLQPLDAQGRMVPTRRGERLITWTEPIRFSNISHSTVDACHIAAEPIAGLVVGGGSVVPRIRSYPNLLGQALQACADSSYAINGQHLLATMLLSAAHPGSTPASLPAALPLHGHPGVFYEPEVEGGETLARRIAGAWLVVSKGENRQQRLMLLGRLHVTVDARVPIPRGCVVPLMSGEPLRMARAALDEAHCALGTITVAKGEGVSYVVGTQGVEAGTRMPEASPVNIQLVPVPAGLISYKVPSDAMEPSFPTGTIVWVETKGYSPGVGDVVLLHPPQGSEQEQCGPRPHVVVPGGAACSRPIPYRLESVKLLRRIVAGPGDIVSIAEGHVVRNGRRMPDSYIRRCGYGPGCNFPIPIKIPPDHWFVLGDNRGESVDSRYWGPVPTRWIIGQVVYCTAVGRYCGINGA